MNNICILCLSDIHFVPNQHEGFGLVARQFFKDLEKQLSQYDKENVYCIIAGDLVNIGGKYENYIRFYEQFYTNLAKLIKPDNIICTPGNHDLDREVLSDNKWKKKHNELIQSNADEVAYNQMLMDENESVILKKFNNYDTFCRQRLNMTEYNLFGFSRIIIPEISIFFLNSALLSNGGKKGFPDDMSRLRIETSKLYEWIDDSKDRTRLLVMHHPIHHLTEYAQHELDSIMNRDHIDVVITGHLHQQDFKKYIGIESEMCRYCSCPPLYSGKHDQNGYSLLHFSGSVPVSMEYRKWAPIREEFVSGNEFTGTPDGCVSFKKDVADKSDDKELKLLSNLQRSLRLYNYQPTWVDRYISNVSSESSAEGIEIQKKDHIAVVHSTDNLWIMGAPQFGLSSFAHKLIYEAWKLIREDWLYIDGACIKESRCKDLVKDFAEDHSITSAEVRTIIIDNWSQIGERKDNVLAKIKEEASNARIIILDKQDDSRYFDGLTNSGREGFQTFYLRELDRKAIRQLTKEFLSQSNISETDNEKIIERLIIGLMDLNVHRTPVNCIQLLLNFQQNYEAQPVNRSKILDTLIKVLFLKPDSFFYTNNLDDVECCMIMGSLCEHLMRQNDGRYYLRWFTEDDYKTATSVLRNRFSENVMMRLFEQMKEAQIIVPYLNYFEFRFSYWVYYFTAYQMYHSKAFYNYMVHTQKCIYMPDIVEFYSGIDHKCEDLVSLIIQKLNESCSVILQNLGINAFNPYNLLKCRPNKSLEDKTQEQIEQELNSSKMPEAIKDSVKDKEYNNMRPFNQAIETVMEEYKVKNMMTLTRSASRALRNSQMISSELRKQLFLSIQNAWNSIVRVLILLTPALVQTGRGGMGGANFALTGNFPDDPKQKFIHILSVIPFNIARWYINDVYSEKRFPVYKDAIANKDTPDIIRHVDILIVIAGRPSGWQETVLNYINTVKRNSFYLGDVLSALNYCYRWDTMTIDEQKKTKKLILGCINLMKRPAKVDPKITYNYFRKKDDTKDDGFIKRNNFDI